MTNRQRGKPCWYALAADTSSATRKTSNPGRKWSTDEMWAYLCPSDLPSNLKLHALGNLLTWTNLFIRRPHWRQSREVWGYPKKAAICELIYMAMRGKRREPTTLGRTVGYQWQPGTIFRFMRTEKASNQRHKPINTDYLLSSRHTVGNGRQSKLIKLKKQKQKTKHLLRKLDLSISQPLASTCRFRLSERHFHF